MFYGLGHVNYISFAVVVKDIEFTQIAMNKLAFVINFADGQNDIPIQFSGFGFRDFNISQPRRWPTFVGAKKLHQEYMRTK